MSPGAKLKQETSWMMQERDEVERPAEIREDERQSLTGSGKRSRTSPGQGPRYHAVTIAADGTTTLHALPASGDDEAIALALSLADGRLVEVWDGPRLLERFSARTR